MAQRQAGLVQAKLRRAGAGGADTPTLAAVYAAGAAPVTDDLMALASGTKIRFQANTDASALPLIGVYETGASKPLTFSGLPAIGQSLATDLSALIGGRLFNWYQLVDPLWNGNFSQLAGYAWTIETGNFKTDNAGGALNRTNPLFQRSFTATKNYSPASYPAAPLNTGFGAMFHTVALYNSDDDAIRTVEQTDSFGQVLRELSPLLNGVTYQWGTHFRNPLVAVPAAGDGAGWGVWNGDLSHGGDTPQASFSAQQTTASPANDWKWVLALRDTAGDGLLHNVAAFARTGITFSAPVDFSASNGVASYVTPEMDLTALNSLGAFNLPSVAGKTFVVLAGRMQVTQQNGTITSTCQVAMAQNAYVSGSIGPNQSSTLTLPYNSTWSISLLESFDTTAGAVNAKITTAGVLGTATVFKGKFIVIGVWL